MNLSKNIMVEIMKANNLIKVSLFITFITIFLIISIPTGYKVIKEGRSKRALANEKLIVEKAEKCIYESKCTTNTITLKMLYDLNYIKDKIVNPYDKTIYSDDSYVVITKEGSTLFLK